MSRTPLRAVRVELERTIKFTEPEPTPPFAEGIAIRVFVLSMVQGQSGEVITLTVSAPPPAPKAALSLESAYSQTGGTITVSVALELIAKPKSLVTRAK